MKTSFVHIGIPWLRFHKGIIAVLALGLGLGLGLAGCAQPKPQGPQQQSTVEVLSRAGTQEVPERPMLRVRQVVGQSRYSVGDYPSVTLKPNMNLPEGSEVRTGSGSTVDVVLPAGQLAIRLMPQSSLLVEELNTQVEGRPRLHLMLQQGRLLAVLQESFQPGQLEVGTEFGRAGVLKAGSYDFYADGRMVVGEGDGRAAMVYLGLSSEQIPYVHAGQMFNPKTKTTGTTPPAESAGSQKHFRELKKVLESP